MSLLPLIIIVWVAVIPLLAVGLCVLAARRRAPDTLILELRDIGFDAHAGRIRTPPRRVAGRSARSRAR